MKKTTILMTILLLLSIFPLKATNEPIKVFSGFGYGAGDLKKLNANFGIETGITKKLSFIGEFDYYFNPNDRRIGNSTLKYHTHAFTIGAFIKHNIAGSFFLKAGGIFAKDKATLKINNHSLKSESSSSFGFGGGPGIEIPVAEKLNTLLGADFYSAGDATWLKFYVTISYQVN